MSIQNCDKVSALLMLFLLMLICSSSIAFQLGYFQDSLVKESLFNAVVSKGLVLFLLGSLLSNREFLKFGI